ISFRWKLGIPLMVLVVMVLYMGLYSLQSNKMIAANAETIAKVNVSEIQLLLQADRDLYQALAAERSLFVAGLDERKIREIGAEHKENIQQGQARILESLALSNTSTEEEKARFLEYFKRWETLSSDIVAKASQYPELRLEQLPRSFGEGYEVFSDLRGYIDLLGERRLDHVNQFIDQSTQARESTRNHLWLLIVIVALVSLATTFLLPSLVITPLQKISHR